MDVCWCYVCQRHLQDDNDVFCSPQCRDVHAQQERSLVPVSSVPSSPLSIASDLSSLHISTLPAYSAPPVDTLHAEDWIGKGRDGVRVWAAAVPLGASPTLSPTHALPHTDNDTEPPRVRHRKSTGSTSSSIRRRNTTAAATVPPPSSLSSSAHQQGALAASSSSTLRPSLPLLKIRRPAPPRLFLHNSAHCHHHYTDGVDGEASACSPCTATCTALPHASTASLVDPVLPPSPRQPILAARTSLPSLTAQSATASLTSLATPHTSSRPPSRPQSRPSSFHPSRPHSRSVSVVGGADTSTKKPQQQAQCRFMEEEDEDATLAEDHQEYTYTPEKGRQSTSQDKLQGEDEGDRRGEAEEEHTPSRPAPRKTTGFLHSAVQRVASGVKRWASAEPVVCPYSISTGPPTRTLSRPAPPPTTALPSLPPRQTPSQTQTQAQAQHQPSRYQRTNQHPQQVHTQQQPATAQSSRASSPRPVQRTNTASAAVNVERSPVVMYVQDDLVGRVRDEKERGTVKGRLVAAKRQQGTVSEKREVKEQMREREHGTTTVRMGRGLVPARVASRMDVTAYFNHGAAATGAAAGRLERHDEADEKHQPAHTEEEEDAAVGAGGAEPHQHAAWRNRGRRAQRGERRFVRGAQGAGVLAVA